MDGVQGRIGTISALIFALSFLFIAGFAFFNIILGVKISAIVTLVSLAICIISSALPEKCFNRKKK